MTATETRQLAAAPSKDDIREALERVLRSATWSSSPRLSRFLRYVVEQWLSGNADQLKEYCVGLAVFDRDSSFDPRTDTIVRVQARRLRRRLERYYENEGRADPLRIELPKGGYVPHFQLRPGLDPGAPAPRYGPPAPRNPLIGRETELDELIELVRGEARLITLTGPGGCGKTRLAVELVRLSGGEFPAGAPFLWMASMRDEEGAASLIARAFGLRRSGRRPFSEALADHLRLTVREPMLLTLDNVEQIEGIAPLLSGLLDACPRLQILTTSRASLRLYGEHEFLVPPLETPGEADRQLETLRRNPAVELFLARAKAADRTFALSPENSAAVAQICRRLDGLPLAIELAGSRSRVLPPDALLRGLEQPFAVLADGPRDVDSRQRTLRAALDWSYDLLSEGERRLFRRLSIFSAGCSAEGAEAVADPLEDLGLPVSEGLASLVDQNLLYRAEPLGAEARYAMLETIREYGREKLAASADAEMVHRALAAYCVVLAEEGPSRSADAPDSPWIERCEAEYANLRFSLDWLLDAGHAKLGCRLALGLFPYWERRDVAADGRKRLERLLHAPELTPSERAAVHSAEAALICLQGDVDTGVRVHEQALALFRELDDGRGVAREANSLGAALLRKGEPARAEAAFEEALTACRELGDDYQATCVVANLAKTAAECGDAVQAETLAREALAEFQRLGAHSGAAWALRQLGELARQRRDWASARAHSREARRIFQALGDRFAESRTLRDEAETAWLEQDGDAAQDRCERALELALSCRDPRGVAMALDSLAGFQLDLGRPRQALVLAGAASRLRSASGGEEAPWTPADRSQRDRVLAQARARLGEAEADKCSDRGRRMGIAEAVAFARTVEWTRLAS